MGVEFHITFSTQNFCCSAFSTLIWHPKLLQHNEESFGMKKFLGKKQFFQLFKHVSICNQNSTTIGHNLINMSHVVPQQQTHKVEQTNFT
jgi:hypothetical protein